MLEKQIFSRLNAVQKSLLSLHRETSAPDKVLYKIKESHTFFEGQQTVGELTFNIPRGHGFKARSLNFYAGVRIVDLQTPRTSDVTFRPVDLAQAITPTSFLPFLTTAVNFNFALRDSENGVRQNAPCNVRCSFSGRVPSVGGNAGTAVATVPEISQMPVCGWLGKLDLGEHYDLKPGSSLTARITPTFSLNNQVDTERFQFRVLGVLSGYRPVWRR